MYTLHHIYHHLKQSLQKIYEPREAVHIANMLIEEVLQYNNTDRILNANKIIEPKKQAQLYAYTEQLLQHKPIQQVLGYAWFMNKKFVVNEHTLIPRPETEELVQWIINDNANNDENIDVFEVGTGTGIIPVCLATAIKHANITAVDISPNALQIAKKNAENYKVNIDFIQANFLDETGYTIFDKYDVIVSNPPYIPEKEKTDMQPNVLLYEPHTALFVANEAALIFYEKIIKFANNHLKPTGSIYVEISENLGQETKSLFEQNNYKATLKKDVFGKDRMIKATR